MTSNLTRYSIINLFQQPVQATQAAQAAADMDLEKRRIRWKKKLTLWNLRKCSNIFVIYKYCFNCNFWSVNMNDIDSSIKTELYGTIRLSDLIHGGWQNGPKWLWHRKVNLIGIARMPKWPISQQIHSRDLFLSQPWVLGYKRVWTTTKMMGYHWWPPADGDCSGRA